MYRNKRDVDKHVESLLSKLSPREFKTRAYSVARLYFEVGDYASCQKYVEQYLTQKDNNAAAHKLLGQAFQKLGQKDKALEHFKTSLDIDPTQTTTILDICELLADGEAVIDAGRARYWCEKAVATFPRHPVTFRLRERIMSVTNPDPDALISLLKSELAIRPKDVQLHTRLLKHYMDSNEIKAAFAHSCDIEFSGKPFINNYSWYQTLSEVLKQNSEKVKDWLYQQLLLTVKERVCFLSLTETPSGLSKSLVESSDLLFAYDQAIETVAKAGATPGHAELHSSLLQHHRGQFIFHASTFLLKKAKKDQISWRDATKLSTPLMLIASQIVPIDTKMTWLENAPDKQKVAANRWHTEGSYRCSQAGHYILSNIQENKNQTFLDKIAKSFSSSNWREKFYEKLFSNKDHQIKIKTSHFASNAYNAPHLRLPRRSEVEAYDVIAQKEFASSLHHFVWTLSNYKNYAHFTCSLFDMLTPTITNCGPESLNKLDVHAFLYSATLSASQKKPNESTIYTSTDKPNVIPANITDLLCPLLQMKWWDCAYKFAQNELGTELTDIRATLSRGIEVVRCIDNHGLDPELLCKIGRIFCEKAKLTVVVDDKNNYEIRAGLYYSSAIPLLEKLKSKVIVKVPEKRMFDYTHGNINSRELNSLIEESKAYVAVNHINDCEYEKAIELLSNLKSPQALFHLSQAYLRLAQEENNLSIDDTEFKPKYASLLSKAKDVAHKALEKLKQTEVNKNSNLCSEIQELIGNIETIVIKIDMNVSDPTVDGKFYSDDYVSLSGNEHATLRSNSVFRNLSSTPKQPSNNMSNYRTAVDSKILESSRLDQQGLDRIENQIKNLQKRDCTINDFMEQTKHWFEENRNLGNQIISTIHSNIQNTTDQFKLLKISVDQVKGQIDECRNDCKDVGDLKKQIEELKKEVNKLKKATPEQVVDETDLYNLDDDYRSHTGTSNLPSQMPFPSPQVMPSINQRLIPQFPLPYNLYGQNLYNLYNQYSQFAQPPTVPGAQPIFDPTRGQINFPGVFPTPDQMFLDVAHLLPPNIPPATVAPTMPPVPTVVPPVSTAPAVSMQQSAKTFLKPSVNAESMKALPVNVVITSSDPLPTCTTTPAPILSVTIPPKHIKNTPHNYQITLPTSNDSNVTTPVFSFPGQATSSPMSNWTQSPMFKMSQTNSETNDRSVTDGSFTGCSPSLNKSRTLSEKSNTSIENYDPCPDFKPIIPLPAEVKVTTGEEDETAIFSARSKLFRFVDKQWKDRGIGEMKLLKHKVTGKVRVLMRREQVHKICANHIITSEMDIQPMKNETRAYIWVANDFADEVLVLEKFCIRFKTPEIAQEFYNTFEKARQEASSLNISTTSESDKKEITNNINTPPKSSSTEPTKTVVGGFTFSSTPTFKPVSETNVSKPAPAETPTSKVNIFSNLAFKTTTTAPFSNILKTSAHLNELNKETTEITNKFNNSDTVEEYEPNVEFTPVIPLPALVQQKTGEEDENILFEHRAKLLRFDVSSKEWKERGLGNIKLLAHKENSQKLRLLMRREQIMKVCCNHTVTKDMIFQKMPNMDKAVTWCAKDYSDGELVSETFCLRFKTVSDCDKFIDALKSAQSKMKDESKAAKEEQNAAKQNIQLGFGDAFKPKPGAWNCQACYTNNLESFTKCACCEQPNPKNVSVSTSNTSGWGDTFKPKAGSWECKECYIRNESASDKCNACNSLRDSTRDNLENKTVPTTKFSFGIPSQSEPVVKTPVFTGSSSSGWDGRFRAKEGTWECQECFVRNESSANECSACNNPKDPNAKKSPKSIFDNNSAGLKFNFGIPSKETGQKSEPLSIFGSASVQKFSFGIPTNVSSEQSAATLPKQETPVKSNLFNNDGPVNFSLKKDEVKVTPGQSSLLPIPQKCSDATLGGGASFDFKFKPKSPSKAKSPGKTPKGQNGAESDDNDYASEDEGAHLHFTPVVPLPDKIEVLTGEESEDELYGHRAKLFIFVNGEWKERGIGVVKVLKHKNTGKLRVVMRREQVLKICLNHTLTKDIIYKPKDEKNWIFAANDFSEGELTLQKFCLRFKNKEIATHFKNSVDNALGIESCKTNAEKQLDGDEVVFVSEIQATSDEKKMAKELMLPENFFTYKNKEPCNGCRGCKDDVDDTVKTAKVSLASSIFTSAVSTPVKNSPLSFQSPANSFYGTPANFDKTADTAMFRTPLGTIGSNTTSATPNTSNSSADEYDLTDKENTLQQSSGFSGLGEQKTLFGTSQNLTNLSGSGDTLTKSSILAAPKLSSLNLSSSEKPGSIFGENQSKSIFGGNKTSFGQSSETKSVFGNSSENKTIFGLPNPNSGVSTNKSIFSFSVENKKDDNGKTESLFGFAKPEIKSIFNNGDQKPVNLFSGGTQGSLFGPGSLTKDQTKPTSDVFGASQGSLFGVSSLTKDQSKPTTDVFGSSLFGSGTSQPQFGNGNSLFGNSNKPSWSFTANADQKPDVVGDKKDDEKTVGKQEFMPKIDSTLSFAELSSGPGFKTDENFKWEGAGQQLFGVGQQANKENSATDVTVDEEYDPHYEPIVPLPDKIVVTTGEEDEEKVFGERGKLYRYDEKTREWKERGVGEMKVLYHPEKKSYRMLLRREQVHKAVLNMLLFMDLELLPMKNSDRAWTWAGRNFAETPAGEQETLAVRFKSVELATAFQAAVADCVRKLQVAAAQAIREEKEGTSKVFSNVAPLRLPKHLENSARADEQINATVTFQTQLSIDKSENQNGGSKTSPAEVFKQVQFVQHGDNDDDEEEEYDDEDYYNEDNNDGGLHYECDGVSVVVTHNGAHTPCDNAQVQVMFDQEIYSPKILVTDSDTGEILADMLIYTETEFQLSGVACTWAGTDYTTNDPLDKTVTITFPDDDAAMEFYDSCETSKAAAYSSTDPES